MKKHSAVMRKLQLPNMKMTRYVCSEIEILIIYTTLLGKTGHKGSVSKSPIVSSSGKRF